MEHRLEGYAGPVEFRCGRLRLQLLYVVHHVATTHNTAWDYSNVANNYGAADVQAWAAYECQKAAKNLKPGQTLGEEYKDAASYLDYIKADLEKYNSRDLVKDPTYTWRDIDSTTLFNKLRFSPMSVYYFKQATYPELQLC